MMKQPKRSNANDIKMAVPNGMKLLIRSVDDAIDVFNDPRQRQTNFVIEQ